MPDGMDVDTQGLKNLYRALIELSDDLTDLAEPSREAGEHLQKRARLRSPKMSGALAAGIKFRVYKTRAGRVRVRVTSGKVPYAARQHWKQQTGKPGFMYLFRTLHDEAPAITRIFEKHARKQANKFGRKAL